VPQNEVHLQQIVSVNGIVMNLSLDLKTMHRRQLSDVIMTNLTHACPVSIKIHT